MGRAHWLSAVALLAAGCGGPAGDEAAVPQTEPTLREAPALPGFRNLSFSTCCRVPVPSDATAVFPGNLVDSEVMEIERPGLRMKLDYLRTGEPAGSLAEGRPAPVMIGGAPAILRELTGDGGGTTLLLAVRLPPRVKGQPLGAALTVRTECADARNCAAARRIMDHISWL